MAPGVLQTAVALLLCAGAGCCLDVISGGTGNYGGSTSGTGTTGGDSSTTTGTSTGGPKFDAGTCLVGDGVVAAGAWAGGGGSCTVCDPTVNPNDWTQLDAGSACEVMAAGSLAMTAVANTPVTGRCSAGGCLFTSAGSSCDGDLFGCAGGFCNDAGWCEVNQNLGWFDSCWGLLGMVTLATLSNSCAQGPCCLDAGYEGVPDGGGWCCGLVDGGVQTCLTTDQVCYATFDCCQGLSCVGLDGIDPYHPERSSPDGGYGLCVPN